MDSASRRQNATSPLGRLRAALLLVSALATASAAHAGTVSFTCNANINSLGPSNFCSQLNTTVSNIYSSVFSDANASIYIQFGNTGLGQSNQYLEGVTYNTYRNALITQALPVNGGDAIDAAAVASLPSTEPAIFASKNLLLTGALSAALGIPDIAGITAAGTYCAAPGTTGCYNGLITLATPSIVAGYGDTYYYQNGPQPSNSYDIFSVAEHEVDEILGTFSCGGTISGAIGDACGNYVSSVDLFRYNGAGSRVGYTATPAYFSYDGGGTNVANYNYLPNGADYGDFSTTCAHVQDAYGCPGTAFSLLNDGGPEIKILDAVGYNLNTITPEPSSLVLLGTGLTAIAAMRRRFRLTR